MKRIYIPTLQKYLTRDSEGVIRTDDSDCQWELTPKNVIMTADFQILVFSGDRLELQQTSSEYLNHVTGVELVTPTSNVEKLIADGILFLPASVQQLESLRRIIHTSPHERIGELLDLDPSFAKVLHNRELIALLYALYGDHYHLTTYSSNKLLQDVDKRYWHVDYPYHNLSSPYLKHTNELWLSLQVIIPLDDFTADNGATEYIPGSHHLLRWPEPDHTAEVLTMSTGWLAIYIGSLWHTQGLNKTANPRSALLANFSPTFVPAKDNIAEQVSRQPTPYLQLVDNVVKIVPNVHR